MKLKYYLRGMGIGVILTALVMGFALGGRKTAISDAEIIERAKALGMTYTDAGVLSSGSNEDNNNEAIEVASNTALDQTGKEISSEIDQGVADAGASVSESAEAPSEGKTKDTKAEESEAKTDSQKIVDSIVPTASSSETEASFNEDTKTQEPVSEDANASELSVNTEETQQTQTNTQQQTDAPDTKQEDSKTDEQSAEETAAFSTQGKTVTIPGGMSSDGVAQVLYNAGVIDSATSFNRFLIDRGKDRIIRSGTKFIPEGASYDDIANIICK